MTVRVEPSDPEDQGIFMMQGIQRQIHTSPFIYKASRDPHQLMVPPEVPTPNAHHNLILYLVSYFRSFQTTYAHKMHMGYCFRDGAERSPLMHLFHNTCCFEKKHFFKGSGSWFVNPSKCMIFQVQ